MAALVLPVATAGAPLRRLDEVLSVEALVAAPLLGAAEGATLAPDPVLAAALVDDGFEHAFRGAAWGRSHPSLWTITIGRFTTPEGADRAATRLVDHLIATPGAVGAGPVADIPGSMRGSVPTPTATPVYPTTEFAIFAVGRDVVTVAMTRADDAPGGRDWLTELAVDQRDLLLERGPDHGTP